MDDQGRYGKSLMAISDFTNCPYCDDLNGLCPIFCGVEEMDEPRPCECGQPSERVCVWCWEQCCLACAAAPTESDLWKCNRCQAGVGSIGS